MLHAPEVGRCVGDVVLQWHVAGASVTTCSYDHKLVVTDYPEFRKAGPNLTRTKI